MKPLTKKEIKANIKAARVAAIEKAMRPEARQALEESRRIRATFSK